MSDRKINSKLWAALALPLLLLWQCAQPVDLPVAQEGAQMIIFGHISNGTEGNFVSVHKTAAQGQPPTPILSARVFIESESGEVRRLVAADSGRYVFDGFQSGGTIGQSYALRVELGSRTFTTTLQEMPRLYGRDSMYFELSKEESISTEGVLTSSDVVDVYATTTFDELPEEFYIRWDLEEAYTYLGTYLPASHFPPGGGQVQCYVINRLNEQEIFLHNGAANRAPVIPGKLFHRRLFDKSFQAKHYFNLIRSSLSKDAHRYWSQLDLVSNREGSIFDVPPAGVRGNIESSAGDEVLGYFEVVSLDTTRLLLTHNDVPFFFFDECVKRGEDFAALFTVPRGCVSCLIEQGIVELYCLNCNVLPGSSYQRPSYF